MERLDPRDALTQAVHRSRTAEDWFWASAHLRLIAAGQAHDTGAAHAMYDHIEAECAALAESCRRARRLWRGGER